MPASNRKTSSQSSPDSLCGNEYRGKQTRTGNSSGFRFESALFKSHPEFSGEVKAHVIAPGRMLVMAVPQARTQADPVMASFLAFLARDIQRSPETIKPLSAVRKKRMAKLTQGVEVDLNADLGDEALL
jgi:hypothetical protein